MDNCLKKMVILTCILFAAGCSGKPEKRPSYRLQFSGLAISYMTPDNWAVKKIPGNKYPVVYTDLDYGIAPNIQLEIITERAYSIDSFIEKQTKNYKEYSVVSVSDFVTDKGKAGEKVEVRRVNNKAIPVSHFYYYLKIKDMVYLFTATCPEVTVEKYRETFDKTLRTVEAG